MSLHYQSGSTADNNGGSVSSYNISSDILNDVAPVGSNLAYTSGPKDNNNADKANAGGVFAKNTNSLLAMRSDALVNSTAVLQNASGYPEYTRSIKYIESRVTSRVATAIRAGKFNIYDGTFAEGFPASSTDNFGNDDAARVTFAVPGSLTFMVTGKTATTQNYPAKG
jgi:hypothetical protein